MYPINPYLITADQEKIVQLLEQLISNALKFTEQGSVTVSAQQVKDSVQIKVSDTGIGIPESEQARLLEDFVQVEREESRRKGGTGLGLKLVREYTRMHGGNLHIASTPQKGSTFKVTLPGAYSSIAEKIDQHHTTKSGLKVLCIDDDSDTLKLLKHYSRGRGLHRQHRNLIRFRIESSTRISA